MRAELPVMSDRSRRRSRSCLTPDRRLGERYLHSATRRWPPGSPGYGPNVWSADLNIYTSPSQGTVVRICRRQCLPDCHSAGTSVRRCMPHGSVILAAKLIAGHDAEGERREPRPGRSGCRRCPRSDALAGDGHHHPAGRNLAGGHARERRGGAGRRGPGRQGAGGWGCPERPSSHSAITLSDEGGQGERTRTRRRLSHVSGPFGARDWRFPDPGIWRLSAGCGRSRR